MKGKSLSQSFTPQYRSTVREVYMLRASCKSETSLLVELVNQREYPLTLHGVAVAWPQHYNALAPWVIKYYYPIVNITTRCPEN